MNYCPICTQKLVPGVICSCGWNPDCDYETYLSLVPADVGRSAVNAQRKAYLQRIVYEQQKAADTAMEAQRQSYENQLRELQAMEQSGEAANRELQSQKECYEIKLKKLDTHIQACEAQLENLKIQEQESETEKQRLRAQLQGLTQAAESREADNQKLRTQLQELKLSENAVKTENQRLQNQLQELTQRNSTCETESQTLRTKIASLETEAQKLHRKIADLEVEAQAFRSTTADLNSGKPGKFDSSGKQQLKAGDEVVFGRYQQEKKSVPGQTPIRWIVLTTESGKALLISKYALDARVFHQKWSMVTWETCTLRKWLNAVFYQEAFNAAEKAKILTTNVTAEVNPLYSTNAGGNTQDRIFLLNIAETEKYFPDEKSRMCMPTDYTVEKGVEIDSSYSTDGSTTCWWWLRSPGFNASNAAYVHNNGSVRAAGRRADSDGVGIRPVLWIKL